MTADPIPELKRALTAELVRAIDGQRVWIAATTLQIDGKRVTELRAGDLRRFSTESLIRFLDRAGYDIAFTITKRARRIENRAR